MRCLSDGEASKCVLRHRWALQSAPIERRADGLPLLPYQHRLSPQVQCHAHEIELGAYAVRPRMLNCHNPSTLLIQPLDGSAIHFRLL